MTQIKTTYIDHMGSDLSVVNAARVSFGKKSEWGYCGHSDSRDKGLSGERRQAYQVSSPSISTSAPLAMPLHPSTLRLQSLWHDS